MVIPGKRGKPFYSPFFAREGARGDEYMKQGELLLLFNDSHFI